MSTDYFKCNRNAEKSVLKLVGGIFMFTTFVYTVVNSV